MIKFCNWSIQKNETFLISCFIKMVMLVAQVGDDDDDNDADGVFENDVSIT